MSSIDLHCHSTCSDGVLEPAAVVQRAAERGVRVLALTDHDETAGLMEARLQARAAGIEFVNGVEISVTWHGCTLHIVGLHIDPEQPELAGGLAAVRSGRDRRAEAMAAALEAAGIDGALDGARSFVTNPRLVGRTHFARYVVQQRHARDLQDAFRRYLAEGRPGYVPHQWASLSQAVHWIKASGGIAVLAHPGRYRLDAVQQQAVLEEFRACGGAAVEVVTGSHGPEQYAAWARHALRFGLLASAGSDFHAPAESRRDFGALPDLPARCAPVWKTF